MRVLTSEQKAVLINEVMQKIEGYRGCNLTDRSALISKALATLIEQADDAVRVGAYTFTEGALIILVNDALYKFTFSTCPHCESVLSLERYIGNEYIREWLRERLHPDNGEH